MSARVPARVRDRVRVVVEDPRGDRPRLRSLLADPEVEVVSCDRPEDLLHDRPDLDEVLSRIRFIGYGGALDSGTEQGLRALLLLIDGVRCRTTALGLLRMKPSSDALSGGGAPAPGAHEATVLSTREWEAFDALTEQLLSETPAATGRQP